MKLYQTLNKLSRGATKATVCVKAPYKIKKNLYRCKCGLLFPHTWVCYL